MALPRKARKITIDGVDYRWMTSRNSDVLSVPVFVQEAEGKGNVLEFDFPVATNVVFLEVTNDRAKVTCELAGGRTREYQLSLPCVVGAGRGLNTPVYPTFPDVVKSRKKPITCLSLSQLDIPAAPGSARIVSMKPLEQRRQPRKITGTPAEQAGEIIRILRQEAKVLS